VLSVYLNVDQSRQVNLNRGYEKQFNDMMASLRQTIHDSQELERLRRAEHHVADFLKAYEPSRRTLVLVFDETDGFFWNQNLEIPIENAARWDREFFLAPLAAATDDFECYGVVLVDRANARLFTVFMGAINEVARERSDPARVRHIKTVGTDHWGSASQVQRKADEQVRSNLRKAIRDLDILVQSNQINRVVLAGTLDTLAEFKELLPKRLALRVIGMLSLDIDAPQQEVLDATLALAGKYERATEEQLVKEVVTAAAKEAQGVVGLGRTLRKLNEQRVWQLIYSEDFHSSGFECVHCGALFSIERPACFYCDASLTRVQDVVEKSVERALRNGARIEIVRGEAASSLDNAGGIGAFLKARTAKVVAL
jgi:peptide subunit release factor 1 (eRF1)